MSARDRIRAFAKENHNNLIDPWCDPETGHFIDDWEAHLGGLLDAHAHELAEQIRNWNGPESIAERWANGLADAANLIDPEEA